MRPKPVRWVGSSRKDLKLSLKSFSATSDRPSAQCGEQYSTVKALKGFGGRSVLEIVVDHRSDTWRAVYTVRLGDAIYVLHVFQKKSKKGIATPQKDIELISQRLAAAERDFRERQN